MRLLLEVIVDLVKEFVAEHIIDGVLDKAVDVLESDDIALPWKVVLTITFIAIWGGITWLCVALAFFTDLWWAKLAWISIPIGITVMLIIKIVYEIKERIGK